MIDVNKLTQAEIRQLGIEALTKTLGAAGTARFMQKFEIGSSDYTRDRDEILGNPTIEEVVAEIKQMRQEEKNLQMIDVKKLTQSEIWRLGIEALTKALGTTGIVRFVQQFELGSGDDYTRDRYEILGNPTVDEIYERIQKRQQQEEK